MKMVGREGFSLPWATKVVPAHTERTFGWSCHGRTVCSRLDTTGGQLNDFIRNQFNLLAIIDYQTKGKVMDLNEVS
jgi:hypothetical protein